MKFQALNDKISELTVASKKLSSPADQVNVLSVAGEVANEIIKILNPNVTGLRHGEDALEDIISSNNFKNYKVEGWFSFHPIYPDERLALRFYESDLCEVKFYWLNDNSTKARISAGVMLTPNWEDRETTENDDYRVGVDFFLKKDASALLMVISQRGNLRVMEFSERLTHTQVEILEKIAGSLTLTSKKAFHEVLWNALALSEVNKKFYEGVAKQFTILYQHLVSLGKDKDDAKLFSSRLLGRLLFIWFLRKKGVVSQEEKYFPRDIEDSTKYYNSVLKPLFFKTFNTPVRDRTTGDKDTPYLNGGLFEPHDNDWQYEETSFPSNYFNGLYEHLDHYNFTTDESSPDYEQVAIDPEMLGRVFESLLAEQQTDTGEQARKAKGAFYTPREIVSYMCKESLRQYLYTQLGDEKYHAGVDKLLDSPDYEWETAHSNAKRDLWTFEDMNKIVPRVIGMLDSLTVLDPACGSGAFPMGMLQLLTKTYERLDSRFDPYKTKLNIIQNNIFGVDIEPMAVEISRLRAWLAIIVDDDGNIDPLPNLDFKFVCADSLIPLEKQMDMFSDKKLTDKMMDLRNKFFNARKPENKEKYKKDYYKLANSQISMFADKRERQLRSFDPFKNQHPASFFDPGYMFGIQKFSVVIGNPPYVQIQKFKDLPIRDIYAGVGYDNFDLNGNIYCLFYENSINLLSEDGLLCFITSNKWMRAGYGKALRATFLKYNPYLLIDLGSNVFDAATVDTNIIFVLKNKDYAGTRCLLRGEKENSLEKITTSDFTNVHFEINNIWVINDAKSLAILDRIKNFGRPLKMWDIQINKGIMTGFNDAYYIDCDTYNKLIDSHEELKDSIKPLFRGRNIEKFYTEQSYDKYVIIINDDFPLEKYPDLKDHLLRFEDKLRNRAQFKRGDHEWYAIDNCPSKELIKRFDYAKIIYPNMTQTPVFTVDTSGSVSNDKTFILTTGSDIQTLYLCGLLNSDAINYQIRNICVGLGDKGLELRKIYMKELVIPTTDSIEESFLNKIVETTRRIIELKKGHVDFSEDFNILNNLVFDLYGFNESEIALIKSTIN